MLRFQPAITMAGAALLIVPASTLDQDDIDSLEALLASTVRAIEVLTSLQDRSKEGEADLVSLIPGVTETPVLTPRERDDRIETLREEVNLLQTEFDLVESRSLALGATIVDDLPAAASMDETAAPRSLEQGLSAVTTGLDLSALPSLGAPSAPQAAHVGDHAELATVPVHPGGTSKVPPEEPVYSADPLQHAQACFQAGRYAEGLALLEPLEDAHARYWQARCMEKLDRLPEAIALLSKLVDELPDGYGMRRARQDLDFFRWKRDFLAKLPSEVESLRGDVR